MSALPVGPAMPNEWPDVGIVFSALRGIRAVFTTENGMQTAGVKSDKAWIFMSDQCVVCERCSTAAGFPEPPSGQGQAQGARNPLFTTGTKSYALFLLTSTLYPFYLEHQSCSKES